MPRLTYFDFPGGRGEDCRIALHAAGVDFEDDRVRGPAWMERKPSTPWGSMPVYVEDDGTMLGQSNAILAYIGRKHGLHPTDPLEAARHEAVMASVEEVRHRLDPVRSIQGEDEKKAARHALRDGWLRTWAGLVEKQIRGPFLGGDDLMVADLKLWVVVGWFQRGGFDHIGPELFEGLPRLLAHADAVAAHPAVKSWYAR